MTVRESEERSLGTLCRLVGYTRQAYYQQQRTMESDAVRREFVVQEVLRIRSEQKRIGARKLRHMMNGYLEEHGIGMGRDAFFELLREHALLVRKRRTRKPRTTFSAHWMKSFEETSAWPTGMLKYAIASMPA